MRGASIPDPFSLPDSFGGILNARGPVSGQTVRSPAIDPSKKTLVLIGVGQSNICNVNPTLFTPTNSTVVDNFNIFDGAIYNVGGPLLGCSYTPAIAGLGPGNVLARIADTLVTNGKFDRAIMCSIATGSTVMADWGTLAGSGDGLPMFTRSPVLMRRLASVGIVPGMTGVTFSELMMIGETDNGNGTSQASFTASYNGHRANMTANGFTGRCFVTQETWAGGATSTPVRAAQLAVCDSVTIFTGGDIDTLGSADRVGGATGTHLNDAGAAAAAALIVAAMHASGAPF